MRWTKHHTGPQNLNRAQKCYLLYRADMQHKSPRAIPCSHKLFTVFRLFKSLTELNGQLMNLHNYRDYCPFGSPEAGLNQVELSRCFLRSWAWGWFTHLLSLPFMVSYYRVQVWLVELWLKFGWSSKLENFLSHGFWNSYNPLCCLAIKLFAVSTLLQAGFPCHPDEG